MKVKAQHIFKATVNIDRIYGHLEHAEEFPPAFKYILKYFLT